MSSATLKKNAMFKTFGLSLLAMVAANLLGSKVYTRFDLTKDNRYTLSAPAKNTLDGLKEPILVDVLLDGSFPAEFKKLQLETRQILEEFAAVNSNVKFSFVNPLEDESNREETIANLQGLGLNPANITVQDGSKVSQELVFPWAMANLGDKTVRVPLLKNKLGASSEERINNSVQHLEYAFADAFTKLRLSKKKKIAVLKGNGQLDDIYIADFLSTLRDYYSIAPFTLDSVEKNPQKTLESLKQFDLTLIAKPTEAFTDAEKLVLDQFTMNGGKSVWLIDPVNAELDSLFNEQGKTLAFPRELNLNDLFFKYGLRVNPVLVNDLYFTQIVLATGDGGSSQYTPVPWVYAPMVFSANDHPINNNLEALRFQFAGSIDTLKNGISKKVLLTSSPLSKTEGTPREISLDIIGKQPDKASYNNGNVPLAVLLEGSFTSVYKNRVKPIKLENVLEDGKPSKIIVIADGDLIKNQTRNGRPLELGYDKWTNNFYGNKEFLLNCVNYLLDDSGLINIRSKQVSLPFLDTEKVAASKASWQFINIGLPIVLTIGFGWVFNLMRRRRHAS